MIRDALLIAAPLAKLHTAALLRKHTAQKESWNGFVEAHLELIEAAEKLRDDTVKRSKFEQVWPSESDRGRGIQQILETVQKMPLEYVPGFKVPDNMSLKDVIGPPKQAASAA
jgi:hypothetical protein